MAFFSSLLRPFFLEWGHLTDSQILTLQSLFLITSFIAQVPTGLFADRYGRRKSILIGMSISVIGVQIYGFRPDYSFFAAGEIILAIGSAFLTGSDKALVFAALKRAEAGNKYESIVNNTSVVRRLAGSLGAGIAYFIVPYVGLNGLMSLTALPFFAALVVSYGFPDPLSRGQHRKTVVELALEGYWYVRHHRCVRRIILNALVSVPTGYYLLWTYQPYLELVHVPRYGYTFAYVLITWWQVAAVLSSGFLIRIFKSERRYFLVTALVPATGMMLAGIWPSMGMLGLLVSVVAGFGLSRPELLVNYVAKHVSDDVQATVGSFITAIRVVMLAILNPPMGILIQHSPLLAMIVVGAFSFLVLLFPLSDELFRKEDV
jgi:MFS family permease